MSFKPNDTIHTGNYEEYFLLYVDGELNAAQTAAVDAFVLAHPHLAEELALLGGTKLSPEPLGFGNKTELLSPAMKLSTVDEELLLYIDGELPAAKNKAVEQTIAADKDLGLQHALLMKTKLDAGEKIFHPNKKELYRREEKVRVFAVWMRYAAAVLLLLLGGWFFLIKDKVPVVDGTNLAANNATQNPPTPKQNLPTPQAAEQNRPETTETVLASTETQKKEQEKPVVAKLGRTEPVADRQPTTGETETAVVPKERSLVRFEASRFTQPQEISETFALNKTLTRSDVTSGLDERITPVDSGVETAGSEADFKDTKKTPAKGFFRKVSRFIERRTGIGTVNDDNELLIGAVALKLK